MKLSHYISLRYIGMAACVILLSVPVFYYTMKHLMYSSLDRAMQEQKTWISHKLKTSAPEQVAQADSNVLIVPAVQVLAVEKIYNQMVYVPRRSSLVLHRVLEFNAVAQGRIYRVRIQKSLLETRAILRGIILLQSAVFLLLILGMMLINRQVNRRVWMPFYHTLTRLKNYRVDRHDSLNLPAHAISEINRLNQSLNHLTQHNHHLYMAQKEFTEDASHELQSPLASMQANLDLLWQTSPLNEHQIKLLDNITRAVSRMNRFNRALLMLAKITNNQYADKIAVDIDAVVENALAQLDDAMRQKRIALTVNRLSSVVVMADKTLMELLVNNLIYNAVRHTSPHGHIAVEIFDDTFCVKNTAQDGALNAEKLFRRFQKQTDDADSIGIGLEICKKICDFYDFIILYSFENKHHVFSVRFSRKPKNIGVWFN